MEHTEGEWTLNQIGKNGWDVLCGLNQIIAQVFKCYLSEPAEAEANARLIAAAPALLAACRMVMKTKDLVLPKGGLIKAEHADEVRALLKMFNEIDKAIAEAKEK